MEAFTKFKAFTEPETSKRAGTQNPARPRKDRQSERAQNGSKHQNPDRQPKGDP